MDKKRKEREERKQSSTYPIPREVVEDDDDAAHYRDEASHIHLFFRVFTMSLPISRWAWNQMLTLARASVSRNVRVHEMGIENEPLNGTLEDGLGFDNSTLTFH